MERARVVALSLCVALLAPVAGAQITESQVAQGVYPERAVRRDIPITNSFRRALAAGSRDSSGRPTAKYWQLRTDYTINASLDPASQRITGRESIVIHNNTPDTLRQIVLRLDMNHFLFNVPRAATWVPSEETDGMRITRMAVNGAAVNLAPQTGRGGGGGGRGGGRGGAPAANTASGLASTRATVSLANPVLPGARATLEIDWNHKVPGGPGSGHRMTQRWGDTLFQPTQWYPRVAMYDDLRGWDPELYLGPSEFYNNFGRFDVRLDVPAGWLVSGTGQLQNAAQVLAPAARERLTHVLESDSVRTIVGPGEVGPGRSTANGTRLTWHYVADTVNDFAWATAKNFVWRATRATIPEKGRVPIHMFHLPGRANLYENAGPITRHALEFYSKLWFPYPFPQLTLQDGPSTGMEYPMVINSNQGAADHETFHQWAPMTVGNNETWYGWMDEGFNQYSNILSNAARAGEEPVLDRRGQSYGSTSGDENEPPMMWNANYAGPARYSFVTYSKMPLLLSALGGVVGDSAVQKALSDWGKAWMYKHPSPWDWMFFMNNALSRRAGGDLGWFFYYWLFTTESVDGSIESVTTGPSTRVVIRQAGQMPSPVVLKVTLAEPARVTATNATMTDERTVTFTWPASVWFSGQRTFTVTLDVGSARIERIVFDPGCRFPDRDPSDNVWPRGSAEPGDGRGAPGGGGGRGGRGGATTASACG